ncbi:hypothetical protein UJ101_01070 [Flavobacteriaceae bacterium UJ101]|nr:hypothetical protein UJ101_01070 [Flavobacteriaceae bacterium UJ101]
MLNIDRQRIINEISTRLFEKSKKMYYPFIDEDLGTIIFFTHLYRVTNEEVNKNKAINLLQEFIKEFEKQELAYSFIHGFEGIFWAINYFYKSNIINDQSLTDDIEKYLIESIHYDLTNRKYNFIHGCIGKSQIFFLSKKYKDQKDSIINEIINILYYKRTYYENYITWDDYLMKKSIDINYHLDILNYFIKLKEINFQNKYIDSILDELLKVAIDYKIMFKEVSIKKHKTFKPKQNINNLSNSFGYLRVAYSLLYANNVIGNGRDNLFLIAKEMVLDFCQIDIKESGIIYFEKESFYDIGFSHGIGAIVFLLKKVNNYLKLEIVKEKIQYWENQLLINTQTVLNTNETILMPESIWQNETKNYPYDKYSLFDGILGIGLILSSSDFDDYLWAEALGFYQ